MRAFIIACALAALFGSYGADADLGQFVAPAATADRLLAINDSAAATSFDVNEEQVPEVVPRPRRRLQVDSATADGDAVSAAGGSDLAVQTRIQTCRGVSVTITSFGGGEWGQEVESFCEESLTAGEMIENTEAP